MPDVIELLSSDDEEDDGSTKVAASKKKRKESPVSSSSTTSSPMPPPPPKQQQQQHRATMMMASMTHTKNAIQVSSSLLSSSQKKKKKRSKSICESKCNRERIHKRQCSLQESKQCCPARREVAKPQLRQQRLPPSPGNVLPSQTVGGGGGSKATMTSSTPAPPPPPPPPSHCWVCTVPLAPHYAWHQHTRVPHVPCCAVCAVVPDTDDEDDDDTCCRLCDGSNASADGLLFLCDHCDAAWCEPCIHHCYYGVVEGTYDLHVLPSDRLSAALRDTTRTWSCPACDPVGALHEQQQAAGSGSRSSNRMFQGQSPEDLINTLYDAEVEKKACETELEALDAAAAATSNNSEEDEEERSAWETHHVRLADFVSRLQDELETNHDIELFRLYRHFAANDPTLQDPAPPSEAVAAAANAAIAAKPRLEWTAPDPSIYRLTLDDDTDMVEALGDDTTTALSSRATLAQRGWRSHEATAEPWAVAAALREEAAITPKIAFGEATDQALQVEEHQAEPREVQRLVRRQQQQRKGPAKTAARREHPAVVAKPPPAPPLPAPQPIVLTAAAVAAASNLKGPPFTVHAELARHLKTHQVKGIQFMWKNLFADFELYEGGDESKIGGCILAHAMGLGKSLSTICLIHTVMHHVATRKAIRNVLLVVPVNTVQNWEHEFNKWTKHLEPCDLIVQNLDDTVKMCRPKKIDEWHKTGGILIVTPGMLRRDCVGAKPDFVVVDEAHTMLKSATTEINKALMAVPTRRRLALTGSPFQNNLCEYYHFLQFVRPTDVELGTLKQFKDDFERPITAGMLKNTSPHVVQACLMQANRLNSIVRPYLDRVNATSLREDLQQMHQIVLHVRQTKLQTKLYGLYKRMSKENAGLKNFFKMYQNLRPIHNHPATLLGLKSGEEDKWWKDVEDTKLGRNMDDVLHGNKIVLLLHIIAKSIGMGDKVLVCANSLPTLDYIEKVFAYEDWGQRIPSLQNEFPGQVFGGWLKNREFLRIDGAEKAKDRGASVDRFLSDDDVKVFLLSQAGGIGINLVSANRVVLIDSHFNPTVASQAVSRSYRYGQTKPVFCYQLLTEGSMEESIYSRSVNKTGLAFLVVDEKAIDRSFSAQQLNFSNLSWVQCDRCEKWRCLVSEAGIPQEDTENLPDKWFCEMNNDADNNSCEAPEREQSWYIERVEQLTAASQDSPLLFADKSQKDQVPASEQLDDEVLHHVLSLTSHKRKTKMISKNYMHDSLLNTTDSLTALEQIETKVKETQAAVPAPIPEAPPAQLPKTKKSPSVAEDAIVLPEFRLPTAMNSEQTSWTASKTAQTRAETPLKDCEIVPEAMSTPLATPVAARLVSETDTTAAPIPAKKTAKEQFLSADKKPASTVSAPSGTTTRGVSPDPSLANSSSKDEDLSPAKKRPGQPKQPEEEVIDLCDSDDE